MKDAFKAAWAGVVRHSFAQERRAQVAVICTRGSGAAREVLLITSRDPKRWIIPKGWPITGLDGPASALQEAWEEAGVRHAKITHEPLGTYGYDKRLSSGSVLPVTVTVFLAQIQEIAESFPEAQERSRTWVTAHEAATMVAEPELQALLRGLSAEPRA